MATIFFLFLLLLHSLPSSAEAPAASEAAALLSLKDSLHPTTPLSSWTTNSTPCNSSETWPGVVCHNGFVSGLRLDGMGLAGPIDIDSLSRLHHLRTATFSDNAFSGPIPDFGRLHALKSLYLSHNNFSGTIPAAFFSRMAHLKKLWLSGNAFEGGIPSSISKLTHLLELHLEENRFSGALPDLSLTSLRSFNASNNRLEGPIPAGSERFEASSFAGNMGLCGPPLPDCNSAGESGSTDPFDTDPPTKVEFKKTVAVSVMLAALVVIVVAAVTVLAKRNRVAGFDTLGVQHSYVKGMELHLPTFDASGHGGMGSSCGKSRHRGSFNGRQQGVSKTGKAAELVFVGDEVGGYGMAELMRAAAEVLGSGRLGSAYKAVMADGKAVVVKRTKEMNGLAKEEFDAEMRKLGRVRHRNVMAPMAYHYRKEEKLLVFDYVEKGSLAYVLHGNRGLDHAALDWPTRFRILRGVARGMAHLHSEFAGSGRPPHGNLRSGNVLLGRDLEPLLVDYGYVPLVDTARAPQVLYAYLSPEFARHRHVSRKSDVYCLGVLTLELLTGRFPSQCLGGGGGRNGGTDVVGWAAAAVAEGKEGEVVDPGIAGSAAKYCMGAVERLLRLGVEMCEVDPERRPGMGEMARRIEEIVADPARVKEDKGAVAVGSAPLLKDGLAERRSRRDRPDESFEYV